MIRKIIFFIILIFTFCWFAGAYYIKNSTNNLITNLESDNIKISYQNIEVLGFPGLWQIKFTEPKIKFIHHINFRELSTTELIWTIDPTLSKADIVLIGGIKQQHELNNQQTEFFINSKDKIRALIKFNKSLYKITPKENLLNILKKFEFKNNLLTFSLEEKEKFHLADINLKIYKEKHEDLALKLSTQYIEKENFIPFKRATFSLDLIQSIQNSTEERIELAKIIKINSLFLDLGDSNIKLNGNIQFFKNGLPSGRICINLINFNEFINKIIPSNFIISKSVFKNVILNALQEDMVLEQQNDILQDYHTQNDAKFDIEFSKKGIYVGSTNIIDFQSED